MKHYLLLCTFILSLLLPSTATARPLRPGWRVIPGGVQRCVRDPDLRRDVCTTHCNEPGWKLARNGRSCERR